MFYRYINILSTLVWLRNISCPSSHEGKMYSLLKLYRSVWTQLSLQCWWVLFKRNPFVTWHTLRWYSDSKNSKQILLWRGLVGWWVDECLSQGRKFNYLYLFSSNIPEQLLFGEILYFAFNSKRLKKIKLDELCFYYASHAEWLQLQYQ
jgi:hypothetical protein